MLLETHRLLLREYVPDDWRAVLAYQTQPGYDDFYAERARDKAYAQGFVGQFITWQYETPRRRYQLAVALKQAPDAVIGSCGLRLGSLEDRFDAQVHEAALGYELAPTHWGNGYATEAGGALLRFGFDSLSLHRVWSYHVASNQRSAAVLRRLGFQQEGRLRESERLRGAWHDTLLWGLLHSEWVAKAT